MAEFIEYWKSLNPGENIDMHEVYQIYFDQETYLEGYVWQS